MPPKRKRYYDDEPAEAPMHKKQKTASIAPAEPIRQLPVDCWRNIARYLGDHIVPLVLVSKQFTRVFCEAIYEKLAATLGISPKDASSLPNPVKRSSSSLDIFVLLEQAIESAKSKDFDELQKVSPRLFELSSMHELLAKKRQEMEEYAKECGSIRFLDQQNLFFTDMRLKFVELFGGTDGTMNEYILDNEFVWIGKNNSYAHVQQHHHKGTNHGMGLEWLKMDYSVALKRFGSDQVTDVRLTFDSAPIKKTHDDRFNDDYWMNYVPKDVLTTISSWMGLNEPSEAGKILVEAAERCCELPVESSEEVSDHSGQDWNGQIKDELDRILRNLHADGWAKDLAFVSKRIIAKLRIMNLIKNADGLDEKARDELISLFQHAGLKYSYMIDGVYDEPKLRGNKNPVKAIIHEHLYELSFSKKGKAAATLKVSFQNAVATEGDVDCEDMFDSEDETTISFPNDEQVSDPLQKFIEEFELQHVTPKDLESALEALKVLSEVPEKDSDGEAEFSEADDDDDDDNDEGGHEDEEGNSDGSKSDEEKNDDGE